MLLGCGSNTQEEVIFLKDGQGNVLATNNDFKKMMMLMLSTTDVPKRGFYLEYKPSVFPWG